MENIKRIGVGKNTNPSINENVIEPVEIVLTFDSATVTFDNTIKTFDEEI